jgi:hypothetical protein
MEHYFLKKFCHYTIPGAIKKKQTLCNVFQLNSALLQYYIRIINQRGNQRQRVFLTLNGHSHEKSG